jgi:hypothetical protein
MAHTGPDRRGLDAAETELVGAVSRARMGKDLDWLAAHGLRLGGTRSERDAAVELRRRLDAEGIASELHEFDAFVSYAAEPETFGPATVRVAGGADGPIAGKVYAFSASTGATPVEAELVALGIGAPEEYRGVDVRGRIVLTDLSFGLPHSEPARIAQARGAAGLIVVNWSDRDGARTHTSTAKWIWGNPTADDLADLPRIPVVAVSAPDGSALRALAEAGPVRVSLEAQASRQWVRAVQPVATIPGRSERFVLLHCHLDAFGAGVTDNGTGVAGLLEIARVLQRFRGPLGLSVRIAWWACHEMPYDGSTAYLDEHWEELRDRCVATFNADSWALTGSRDRLVPLAMAELQDLVHGALDDLYGGGRERRDFDFKEGEQSFWSPGVSSAFLMSATPDFPDGPLTGTWFHTEFDTREHVDEDALEQLVRAYALIAYRCSAASVLPLRISAIAERLAELLQRLAPIAPADLGIDRLIASAAALREEAAVVEAGGAGVDAERGNEARLEVCRALNPVLYTISGPYGQDPVAASFLRERPAGLARALRGLAGAEPDTKPAWSTGARRERNRLADAIERARRALSSASVDPP